MLGKFKTPWLGVRIMAGYRELSMPVLGALCGETPAVASVGLGDGVIKNAGCLLPCRIAGLN